jgi:hypothetical protein
LGKLQKSISSLKATYDAYIAAIAAGTTIAKKAEEVTTKINGQALTDIFEANGTTVKLATLATTATNIAGKNYTINYISPLPQYVGGVSIAGSSTNDVAHIDGYLEISGTKSANALLIALNDSTSNFKPQATRKGTGMIKASGGTVTPVICSITSDGYITVNTSLANGDKLWFAFSYVK